MEWFGKRSISIKKESFEIKSKGWKRSEYERCQATSRRYTALHNPGSPIADPRISQHPNIFAFSSI